MSAAVQTEIERKYTVEEGAVLPDLGGVTGVARVQAEEPFGLEAVYFDTEALDLARARVALRRRAGGADEGWHLKLPADEGRTEMQWPLTVGESVPDEVLEPVRALVRDRALTPLARIATTRTITELLDEDGGVVVEVADDQVTASDVRGGEVRAWREWEAELGPAAPGTRAERETLLDEVEAVLHEAGATVSPSVSKLAQALGRTGLGSSGADAPAVDRRSSAEEAVLAGVRELVAELIALDPAARRDEPDAVHRMRTTVRRLRNVLATHRALLGRERVGPLREQLSRLGGQLGEVRDLEVRAGWASDALDAYEAERGAADGAARRRLVGELLEERTGALARLRAALTAEPYFRLLDDLEGFGGPERTGDAVSARHEQRSTLRKAAERAVSRSVPAEEAAESLSDGVTESIEALGHLHESRKAARKLRHAAEFATGGAGGVLGARSATLGELAEDLQDALGEHRDASLFAEHLHLVAGRAHASGEDTFVYGVLYQRAQDQAGRALVAADRARRALARAAR
ncbi:CHAD domain-containing protein [Cnuibacter sp. UC19_7]|uniref:CYTH and CHAD domain-containing protein n=1 Tax=Cnuibacter sp. UC19_7 TaxID=3350166 RepID=UPI00366E5A6C